MDFYNLRFYSRYIPEDLEKDELPKKIPVTVKVIYGERKIAEVKVPCENEEE
jgi:hypothetical protein